MTDKEKLDAIRVEIHRLVDVRGYDREMANDLLTFIDSLPNEPKECMYSKANYTDEDRKALCDGCEEECEFNKKEEPASDDLKEVVEEIVDPTVLNAYGVKEIANRLRRTMIGSVSEDLGKAIDTYLTTYFGGEKEKRDWPFLKKMAIHFAEWQKEQFENNRLKHCNSITNEQAELEQGFIDQHLDKYQRMPTFLDAIEYGMNLQKEQMMAKAVKVNISNASIVSIPVNCDLKVGDKVLIIKEN